ncbi:MAG: ABC transporter permease [Clostridia bacterium]|nr:ABC transporter permease [Clostridia bacterium]
MANKTIAKEPLFHVSKRTETSTLRQILTRVIAILSGLILGGLICLVVYGKSPIDFIKYIFEGNFSPTTRIWELLKGTALLLGVCLALIPSFKMKFWNLGGNGQILISALATTACMFYWGGKIPDGLLWAIMTVVAILAGVIWAVIPAIFKAFFNTNESLFTLMMNYIATGLVAFAIKEWGGTNSSGTLNPLKEGVLPVLGNDAVLTILVVALLTIFVTIYMKYSKHGFEISVVGDSENTARYVGINVKKVIIRTLALSGALCGIIGLLLAGALNHNVSTSSANNMGFTAIIAVWIANMSPLLTIASSFGIMFLTYGLGRVQQSFNITNDAVLNMIVGLMYLIVIGCVFFTTYKITFNKKQKQTVVDEAIATKTTEKKEVKKAKTSKDKE